MLQTTHILIDTIQVVNSTLPIYATHYIDDKVPPKATLVYLHGGGLLCGSRQDLPDLHKTFFTQAGIQIIALDYPLAPHAQVEQILSTVVHSLKLLKKQPHFKDLPYFLWGRSAGAYLALLTASIIKADETLPQPKGVLSFYGYGFLTDDWYDKPSAYYTKLPIVDECTFRQLTEQPMVTAESQYFGVYIYARQTGLWKSLIYQGRDKFFYLDYSLRAKDLTLPLFFAHSTGDSDVPFAEFNALCAKYPAERFVAAIDAHDFDRDEQSNTTQELLHASLNFIQKVND
ncbi:alpha/beta hydrolase [Pasteurellaceae bacterium 22721_9_1]